MKLYLLSPVTADNDDRSARKAREARSNSIITSLILDCLHPARDATLHATYFRETDDGDELEIVKLGDELTMRTWVLKSLDPDDATRCEVRSLATCRCVTFGYDGQALICLRSEDDEPVSPDKAAVVVEECSAWLCETDYMDGLIE